jgi:presenilin-like A22 family membrane protease
MRSKLGTYAWATAFMAAALALTLFIASKQKIYVQETGISSPDVGVSYVTLYFFGVVAATAVLLFVIPLRWLNLVFRGLFTLMYAWGFFIITSLLVPGNSDVAIAAAVAAVAGASWLIVSKVWLHNLVLLVTLAAVGSVFGWLFSPWTFMAFMGIIAVYDLLAVRFGFMVWMADKFSETTALPAFIFPKQVRDWRLGLSSVRFSTLQQQEPKQREYSILGGGDIGFPLMLATAVYFDLGHGAAWLVGGCSLLGLMAAYVIQAVWLKEKPMPALPPIATLSLVGLLIVRFWPG